MQYRFFTIAALLLTLLVSSCNFNKQEEALRLSNELGFTNDSLFFYGKVWNDELRIAVKINDYSALNPIRMNLERYINRKIEHIDKLEDVGGSEKMRQSELDFL